MHNNEGTPDNLGGLGELLPAEVLKKVNELLELMQQRGHSNQGSKIELVYVAPGAQHIDTQINIGDTCYKPRKASKEEESSASIHFDDSTPLSALFRENHHKELRQIIDSWRPYLIGDDPTIDALAMTRFEFNFRQTRPISVYMDLARLINHDALSSPMSILSAFMFRHSNLSRSENALYVQLKRYKKLCK